MQKRSSNYERIILGLVAFIAIGVAGWLIYLKMGFADTLKAKTVPQRNEVEPPPVAKVDDAIKRAIEVPKPWVAPVRNNKAVPLNKAVLLAIKGEEVIDMYLESPLMRPPMSNAFLRENDLDWPSPNVGELDPDNDGFNNLEEFTKTTKPKDPQSHPPLTEKLFMVERLSKDYRIVLRNSSGQVSLLDEPKAKTKFLDLTKVGQEPAQFFGGSGDRFKTVKFEVKKMPDPRLGERDVSELTIEEIVSKKQIVLVMGTETNLAEYSVKFQFRLKQITDLAPVEKGGSFRIPGHEDTTYKVLDIQEDKSIISPLKPDGTFGAEIIINKG
jgi:hypothetical protein